MPTNKLFETDAYQQSFSGAIVAYEAGAVVLDQTAFYAEGGGQPGDSGWLTTSDGQLLVVDQTSYQANRQVIVHTLAESTHAVALTVGQRLTGTVDWPRRHRHMRMHTCLHVLCALVNAPITGCAVKADSGRVDFDLPVNTLDKNELSDQINSLIHQDLAVTSEYMDLATFKSQPELIRSADVLPPENGNQMRLIRIASLDLQPCGGTHVGSTAEIGEIRVTQIKKKSAHNRRVSLAFVAD